MLVYEVRMMPWLGIPFQLWLKLGWSVYRQWQACLFEGFYDEKESFGVTVTRF
jgi:hypothetical protein